MLCSRKVKMRWRTLAAVGCGVGAVGALVWAWPTENHDRAPPIMNEDVSARIERAERAIAELEAEARTLDRIHASIEPAAPQVASPEAAANGWHDRIASSEPSQREVITERGQQQIAVLERLLAEE